MNGESELPEGWAEISLKNITTTQSAICYGVLKPGEFTIGGVPLIRVKDIKNSKIEINDIFYLSPEIDAQFYRSRLKGGEILISVQGSVGRIALVPEELKGANISRTIAVLPLKEQLLSKWIYYILQSPQVQQELSSLTGGTTRDSLNIRDLREVVIPLPPLAEQRRIVAAVEALLARVNTSQERLDRVPGLLKAFRQAVLAAACTGKLTEGWRGENPDIEPASSILEDNINQKKIEKKGKKRILRESDNSVLIELPEKWLWVKWGLIGVSQNGRLFPSKEYQSEGVRLLRPGNLDANGKIIWTDNNTRFLPLDYEKNFPEFVLRPNEIVMNLTAQSLKEEFLGRVCMTGNCDHSLLNQRLARLIPINFSPRYTFWVFKSPHFRKFVDKLNTGSMIQHMFTSQLVEYDFPLPPLPEQYEIVRRVESLFALADRIEQRVAAGKEQADRLTQAILAKAFRGELVSTEAELARREGRSYEPAGVLLERIKADRASVRVKGKRK